MEDSKMIVVDETGKEVEYEIVLTFQNEEFGKSYVIYKLPGEENDEVFASSFDEATTDGGDLQRIENESEWDMIEEVLNAFLEEDE